MNTLFKLTHHPVFRIQLQAFKLLLQFCRKQKGEDEKLADRYYRTLYDLIPRVHTSKAMQQMDEYFSLIFRAMKQDKSTARQVVFIKRMLQMCMINDANFTAATLLIISEVLKKKDDLQHYLFPGFSDVGKKQFKLD